MYRVLLVVLTFYFAGWVNTASAVEGIAARNIILIGWDGAQRDHVKECLARKELPQLKKLSSEGALVAIDILRTTDTKAGWAQILTGHEPEVSGVFSNSRYGPIPKGYTVFERLEEFFGKDNFVTVAVIGKKGHVDNDPPSKYPIRGWKDIGKEKKARGGYYYYREWCKISLDSCQALLSHHRTDGCIYEWFEG